MATQILSSSQGRNRLFLVVLIGLFVLPLAVAWLLVGQWRPATTSNHGELLNPAQPIAHFHAQGFDGQIFDVRFLQKRWTLAYLGSGPCDEHCERSLYNMRQVRLALGKDINRVQTLYLMHETPTAERLEWLQREHSAMTAGIADAATIDFFRRAFPNASSGRHWVFLSDPFGNLVMRYSVDENPKGILEDLKRLLKFSKIG